MSTENEPKPDAAACDLVKIPVSPEIQERNNEWRRQGGKANKKSRLIEVARKGGRKSWEKRLEKRITGEGFTEFWKCRKNYKGASKEEARVGPKAVKPGPGILNPEVKCPRRCGFSMIVSNMVRDIVQKGRKFRMKCPRCGVEFECRLNNPRTGITNFFLLRVEEVRSEQGGKA